MSQPVDSRTEDVLSCTSASEQWMNGHEKPGSLVQWDDSVMCCCTTCVPSMSWSVCFKLSMFSLVQCQALSTEETHPAREAHFLMTRPSNELPGQGGSRKARKNHGPWAVNKRRARGLSTSSRRAFTSEVARPTRAEPSCACLSCRIAAECWTEPAAWTSERGHPTTAAGQVRGH